MDSFKLKQLFKKYLEGNSSVKEKKSIDDWYRNNDKKTPGSFKENEEQELREQIWMQIEPELRKDPILLPSRRSDYTWLKIAASIIVVFTAAMLWYKRDQPVRKQVNAFSAISTKAGERKKVILSDGSSLMLNSASAIRITNDFSKRRNVQIIDGEVFFTVKHDVKRPFIIQSGEMTTQVLGTSFNVRAYTALNKFSVGVTTGKVGVMIPNQKVTMLVKGRQLVYNKRKKIISVTALDGHLLDWQNGNMILNDASFEEMAVLVHKNFNITVSTTDQKVEKQHFTATLSTAMTAIQAVEVIAAIHKKSIKKRRDTIEIY